MNTIQEQVQKAKESIRCLKNCRPHFFVQYCKMVDAKEKLKQAKEEYKLAKQAWQELGK